MKWGVENKTAEKGLNSNFQVVGSLIYAHYSMIYILFGKYKQVLCCVKMQETNLNLQIILI